jgi:hypothetical protein
VTDGLIFGVVKQDSVLYHDAMGSLTSYLQTQFSECRPAGWRCRKEARLVSADIEKLLGYSPRADVLLEREDGSRRLWIEFEISRADPVANHAKFATAHLFAPQPATDTFLAMVSPHVNRGRRNLAFGTVLLMRHIGMRAFQTVLFPQLMPEQVKRFNHSSISEINTAALPVSAELDRALAVSEPLFERSGHRVHFAPDLFDVMLNVRQWNAVMRTARGRELWGKRLIKHFAHDPITKLFAPSKFCGYLPLSRSGRNADEIGTGTMTMDIYVSLDESEPRFDGHLAWQHLTRNLFMTAVSRETSPTLQTDFSRWHAEVADAVLLNADGPIVLIPPIWFK